MDAVKHSISRFQVFSGGNYLGTINRTLRVVDAAIQTERYKNAFQFLIDQHPVMLLIMPEGEHKKSKAMTLAKIAPKLVSTCRRKNTKKRPIKGKAKGSDFSKKRSPGNKDLQTTKTPFFEKSRSVK